MNSFIKATIILLILDSMYLYSVRNHFSKLVKNIQKTPLKLNIYAVIACYILLIGGFNYFIIKDGRSPFDAFVLGFIIYGVYDLTNMAIFKNWGLFTLVIDTLWGGFLFSMTAYLVKNK